MEKDKENSPIMEKDKENSPTMEKAKHNQQGPGPITQLVKIVEKKIQKEGVNDEVQVELAMITNLLAKFEKSEKLDDHRRYLELALKSLAADEPKIHFVRGLRTDLEFRSQLYESGLPKLILKLAGPTPISAMIAGLLAALVVWPLVYFVFAYFAQGWIKDHFVDVSLLHILVTAAFFGGVVSLLARLDQFGSLQIYRPTLVFLTAFWKPLIGVALSVLIYAVFASGLFQGSGFSYEAKGAADTTEVANIQHYYLVWVIGFLCGFSERLARDLVRRAENQFLPADVGGTEKR